MLSELQHLLLDLVHPILQMEANQVLGAADTAGGRGLEQQTGCPISIIGGGDDAGSGGKLPQLLAELGLAQNQTVYIQFQRSADHIRLMAAQNNGIFLVKQQILPALRQSDGDLTAEKVSVFTGFVENLALQGGENIEQRNPLQNAGADLLHIVAGNVFTGQHAVKRAVLIDHRHGGNVLLLLQNIPCTANGDAGVQNRRGVEIQVLNLGVHIVDPLGRLKTELFQHQFCFVRNAAQAGGFIFAVAYGIAQSGISHCGNDGVSVGVSMAGNINRIHKQQPPKSIKDAHTTPIYYLNVIL